MNKQLLWLVFVVGLLGVACSNTFEFVDRILAGTPLYFEDQKTTWKDSVKMYFKDAPTRETTYRFYITPSNEGVLKEVTYQIEGGTGTLSVNRVAQAVAATAYKAVKMKKDTLDFTLDPQTPDGTVFTLTFTSRSTTEKLSEAPIVLTLKAFKNYVPVALFSATASTNSQYDYTLDATTSYDADKAFGGYIVRYLYTITGTGYSHAFETDKKTTPYSFPKRGSYTVQLIVKDNDNGLSAPITKTIQIN